MHDYGFCAVTTSMLYTVYYVLFIGFSAPFFLFSPPPVRPVIRVPNQKIYARDGQTVTIECLIEAFPKGIHYWELDSGKSGYEIYILPDHSTGSGGIYIPSYGPASAGGSKIKIICSTELEKNI